MRALILGGTFNPVHIGHLRLATEAREALGIQRVIWLPSHAPHYRSGAHLLRFALRLERLAVARCGEVSDIERRAEGFAYSAEVVPALCREEGIDDPCFLLGLENFRHLPFWHRARDLAGLTSFAVVAREGADAAAFHRLVGEHWPDYRALAPAAGVAAGYESGSGRRIVLLAVPRLDISSSLIRERWRAGRDIGRLVPDAVLDLLQRHRAEVDAAWRQEAPHGEDRRPFPH